MTIYSFANLLETRKLYERGDYYGKINPFKQD